MGELRPVELLEEVRANLASQLSRTLLLAAIATALVAAPALLEALWAGDLVAAEREFAQKGGFTGFVRSEGMPAERCRTAARQPFVTGAAGIDEVGLTTLATQPSTRYPLFDLTPGALGVVAPGFDPGQDAAPGVVLGPAAASESGASAGDLLRVGGDVVPVLAVIPEEALRIETMGRAVLRTSPAPTTVDACYLDLTPAGFQAGLAAVDALVVPTAADAEVRPYTLRGEFAVPPEKALAGRGHRWAWVVTGLALALAFGLDTWSRRTDLALYRSVGVSPVATVLLVWSERVLLAWLALVAGGSAALLAAVVLQGSLVPDQALLTLRAGALTALVGLIGSAITTSVVASRVSATTLRDR